MPYLTPITSLIIVLQVRTWFPPDVRGGQGHVYHILIFPTLQEYALVFQPSCRNLTGPGARGAKLGQTPNTDNAAALRFPGGPVPGSLTMAQLQEATIQTDATDLTLPDPPPPVRGMGTLDSPAAIARPEGSFHIADSRASLIGMPADHNSFHTLNEDMIFGRIAPNPTSMYL
jgi:hypothetical protein